MSVRKDMSAATMRVPLRGKNTPRKRHFRFTVVGDRYCGKTALVRSYATSLTFPYRIQTSRPAPTQYPVKRILRGEEYSATINDSTFIGTSLEKRIKLYDNSDAIIICFSLVNQSTFKSVKDKWLKEVQAHCPNTPVVLVGTKSDLVHSPHVSKKEIVTTKQIDKLLASSRILNEYCESSALTKDGLDNLFERVFNTAWVGPVRYVMRMKTVKPSTRLRLIFLPCIFKRRKNVIQ